MTSEFKKTEPKFLGPITTEEARVLFAAPVDDVEIDTSTKEGQKAAEILSSIGATGAREEVAVVVNPVEGQMHLEPTELRVLDMNDLGTLILKRPSVKHPNGLPTPQEALQRIQLPS